MSKNLERSLALLSHADAHQRHAQALARATGEHYNIFKILGIGHYEVLTHSPMLADLLSPNGAHCQHDAFLRLFVKQMGVAPFHTASAQVKLEHYIGPVTEKSGGRIDIVITDKDKHAIFIENKIYAEDQDAQLQRYRAENKNADLFYLTLEGAMPSGFDEAKLKAEGVKCISYATDIRDWLLLCKKEAAAQPHVRETISQYLHLVRDLTGQCTAQAMNHELIQKITAKPDDLAAYFALIAEEDNVKAALVAELDAQLDGAAKEANLQREGRCKDLHAKHSGICFTTKGLERNNLKICFAFDCRGYHDLDFGFAKTEPIVAFGLSDKLLRKFREKFSSFSATTPTKQWPAWANFEEPYSTWGAEAFQAIVSGILVENMKTKLVAMAEIAREVFPD